MRAAAEGRIVCPADELEGVLAELEAACDVASEQLQAVLAAAVWLLWAAEENAEENDKSVEEDISDGLETLKKAKTEKE